MLSAECGCGRVVCDAHMREEECGWDPSRYNHVITLGKRYCGKTALTRQLFPYHHIYDLCNPCPNEDFINESYTVRERQLAGDLHPTEFLSADLMIIWNPARHAKELSKLFKTTDRYRTKVVALGLQDPLYEKCPTTDTPGGEATDRTPAS